jgi:DNA-directed RNA polymerase subunit L
MWSEHRVRKWDLATYRMHHPLVGRMQLNLQTLNVPQEEGLRIVVATADSGTASEAALRLLAQVTVPAVRNTVAAERR